MGQVGGVDRVLWTRKLDGILGEAGLEAARCNSESYGLF